MSLPEDNTELRTTEAVCSTEPCPEVKPTRRSWGQELNPTPWAKCPMCRESIDGAMVTLVQRLEPPLAWWRRLALALRYGSLPATGWVEHERVVSFGPCCCHWTDTDNPLMRMVVEMHASGAAFLHEMRPSWHRPPHVVLMPAPCTCTCNSTECGDDE